MNPFDILGSLMNGRMGPSAGRLERTFGNQGFGVPGGMPGGMPPAMPGGGPGGGPGGMFGGGPGGMPGGGSGAIFEMLGKMAQSMFGGGAPGTGGRGGFSPFDILSSIGKTVFGGSSGGSAAGPSSAGWGANTVLGAIAAQALAMVKRAMGGDQGGDQSQAIDIDDATAVIAGMRKPANADEEQQVYDVATLTVRAMINAAKADGRIDEQETERLVGAIREDGVSDEEQRFVMEELRKPMDTDAIVRAVSNPQVAAQIYTASLMAINVDTDAEKRYMQELAEKLGLNKQVAAYLHQAVGLA